MKRNIDDDDNDNDTAVSSACYQVDTEDLIQMVQTRQRRPIEPAAFSTRKSNGEFPWAPFEDKDASDAEVCCSVDLLFVLLA